MPFCGSADRNPSGAEQLYDGPEEDRTELEQGGARIEELVENYQSVLAGVLEEASATEAWGRAEEQAAKDAEARQWSLSEEFAELSMQSASVNGLGAYEGFSQATGVLPLPTSWRQHLEIEQLALAEAESEAEDFNLGTAEYEENCASNEEHAALKITEAPLQEWVLHAEMELGEARAENKTLGKQLLAMLDRRAHLHQEDIQALPLRQYDVDAEEAEAFELQGLERRALERKAALSHEIHEHRSTSAGFLAEVARCHEQASAIAGAIPAPASVESARTIERGTWPPPPLVGPMDAYLDAESDTAINDDTKWPAGHTLPSLPSTSTPEGHQVSINSRLFGNPESGENGQPRFVLPDVSGGTDSEDEHHQAAADYWEALSEEESNP